MRSVQGLRSFKDTLPVKVRGIIKKKGRIYSGLLDNWRSIVGDDLFNVESGIIANWLINCGYENQTELFPFRPSMVGQNEPEIVIGKGSGIDSIKDRLNRFQIKADDKQAMDILMAIKDWGLKHKRLMNDDEFRAIAEQTLS